MYLHALYGKTPLFKRNLNLYHRLQNHGVSEIQWCSPSVPRQNPTVGLIRVSPGRDSRAPHQLLGHLCTEQVVPWAYPTCAVTWSLATSFFSIQHISTILSQSICLVLAPRFGRDCHF